MLSIKSSFEERSITVKELVNVKSSCLFLYTSFNTFDLFLTFFSYRDDFHDSSFSRSKERQIILKLLKTIVDIFLLF